MRKNFTSNLNSARDRALVREVKARGKARRRADLRRLTRDPSRWDDMADVAHDVPRVGYVPLGASKHYTVKMGRIEL